ncbi:iron-siderophore ABC transporter substrate-binding protein [Microbacterium sp. Marseille-Q6965]|uniref:iron-siderophore ABC transporter substrate-binding protein n=1 Tax=Microbacterium sp. Marseille-Q6965 TaxID=2965072 RepID=UPI0021B7B573|nr:iron-siderophore ABC transporter substrate-binding protein [Microbacterium sp. Marseille-Q6965]
MLRRPLLALAAGVGSIALLASCATSDAPAEAGASDDTITIEHALGTTEVPANPERVAAIGWGNHDTALALGIAPVGVDDQTWSMDGGDGLGIYEWSLEAYDELGAEEPVVFDTTDGVDFEAIAETAPDLIIAAQSGLTEEDYETLSEIAPVVAHPGVPWLTSWRDSIALNSEALGRKAEGEQLIADLEQQIADATADAGFEGKTAAFFSFNEADLSTTSVYTDGDVRSAFLGDLGFEMPQVAIEAAESGTFYADIAADNADRLADVDVIVTYGHDSLLAALQADPLWNTVPAVQNGAVVTVGAGEPLSGAVSATALSIPWMLDEYVGLLSDAAATAE